MWSRIAVATLLLELSLRVKLSGFVHAFPKHDLALSQDLDLIEAALTDLETIKHRQFGGDYLVYQMNTLLKVSVRVCV